MKTLLLMRHAEADWGDASLADFDRPLNDHGLRGAPFMGRHIAEHDCRPEAIVSSPARRARETAELVNANAGLGLKIRYDLRIYEASPNTLREVASELPDRANSAMIIGHNPGMEGLIRYLTGQIEAMPTAAVAVIELDIDSWVKIDHLSGRVVSVLRPDASM